MQNPFLPSPVPADPWIGLHAFTLHMRDAGLDFEVSSVSADLGVVVVWRLPSLAPPQRFPLTWQPEGASRGWCMRRSHLDEAVRALVG